MDKVARFAASEASKDENANVDQFCAWVRQHLLPRNAGGLDA
jgi:hypothetical protein